MRLSLAAAMAAGKPMTAEARIEALLKLRQDPELLLTAARIAETLSDKPMALTRYLAYGRAETRKSDTLHEALTYVLQRDGFPDEFRKYVETFGATGGPGNWPRRSGAPLAASRGGPAPGPGRLPDAEMARTAQVAIVHRWLNQACDCTCSDASPGPGTGGPRRWPPSTSRPNQLLEENDRARPGGSSRRRSTRSSGSSLAKTWNAPPPFEMFNGNWFTYARSAKDEEVRLQLGRQYLAIEKIFLDSKNPEDYQQYFEAILQSPQVFNVKDKALLDCEALEKKFDALRSRLPADPARFSPYIQSMQQGWPQRRPSGRPSSRSSSPCSKWRRSTSLGAARRTRTSTASWPSTSRARVCGTRSAFA